MNKQTQPGDLFNKMMKKKKMLRSADKVVKSEQNASHQGVKSTKKPTKGVSNMSNVKMKKKNFIAGAIKKPGALRKSLGIKTGKKIPAKTLAKTEKKGGKMGQRARFAETLKSFHKSKKTKKK